MSHAGILHVETVVESWNGPRWPSGLATEVSRRSLPDTQLHQLHCCYFCPTAIGCGTGGTRVKDLADIHRKIPGNGPHTFGSETSDPDDPFRSQHLDHPAEVFVTCVKQHVALVSRQLDGSSIASGCLNERQRTIVHDKMISEKRVGSSKAGSEQPPQTLPADFRSRTVEAEDRSARVFAWRSVDRRAQTHPIANCTNLAERHTGLHHAERARVHSDEEDSFLRSTEAADVPFVNGPCIRQRIVHVSDRCLELQVGSAPAERLRRGDEIAAGLCVVYPLHFDKKSSEICRFTTRDCVELGSEHRLSRRCVGLLSRRYNATRIIDEPAAPCFTQVT